MWPGTFPAVVDPADEASPYTAVLTIKPSRDLRAGLWASCQAVQLATFVNQLKEASTMRLGKSLIGNPVFGISDGRKLGEIKDLYLDDDLTTVMGIYLGREGLLRPTPVFVERGDVVLFGIDAVLTKTAAAVYEGKEAPKPPGWLRLDTLQGRQVRTPGGTKIGKVSDVVLDEEARVVGLSLGSLSVKGPLAEAEAIARKTIVDVGATDDVMTIDLAEAERAPVEIDQGLLFTGAQYVEVPPSTEAPEEVSEPFEEPDHIASE